MYKGVAEKFMGGKNTKILAYSGIAIFILAIVYFIVSIYATMLQGEEKSRNEFASFVQNSNINSYVNSMQTTEGLNYYFNSIKNAVDNNSYIAAVNVSKNTEPFFVYPANSSVVRFDTTNKPVLIASSPMLKTHSIVIPSQTGQDIVLNAVSYVLRPVDIYNSARISFLIILAYTLVLIVFIVYYVLTSANGSSVLAMKTVDNEDIYDDYDETETIPVVFREKESTWDDFFDENESETEVETNGEAEVDTEDNSIENIVQKPGVENLSEIATETEPRVNESEESNYDAFIYDYIAENAEETEDKIEIQNIEVEDSTVPIVSDPMGLFSDVTGVSWESYMETRLDAELIRAASSEQDLALIFIQIKGIENQLNTKKKIATMLLEYFKYRDFVFEYKDNGFAGIILNNNLDQSMVLSEEIYNHIITILKDESLVCQIGIGLSTRALRILPGSRIMTEVSEAVERSFEEENLPIVAFRVNAEKYRQFVSSTHL